MSYCELSETDKCQLDQVRNAGTILERSIQKTASNIRESNDPTTLEMLAESVRQLSAVKEDLSNQFHTGRPCKNCKYNWIRPS